MDADEEEASESECPVCFREGAAMCTMACCGHAFCGGCLRRWSLHHKAICPMCRAPIVDVKCVPTNDGEVLLLPSEVRRVRLTSYRTRTVVLEAPPSSGIRPGDVVSTEIIRNEHPLRRYLQECESSTRICALRVERCYDRVVFRKRSVFVRVRGRTYVWRAGTLVAGARVTPSNGVRIDTTTFRRLLRREPWESVRLLKFFARLDHAHYVCDAREDAHYIFSAVR